jgi:hypothetical protein
MNGRKVEMTKHVSGTAVAALALGAALAFATPAHADVRGLGPFVGQWGAHGESLTVNSDGSATETSRYGSVNIQFRAADGSTAAGVITSATNPRTPAGGQAGLDLVDGGRGLLLTIMGGDNRFPFCKIVNGSKLNSDDCGA